MRTRYRVVKDVAQGEGGKPVFIYKVEYAHESSYVPVNYYASWYETGYAFASEELAEEFISMKKVADSSMPKEY